MKIFALVPVVLAASVLLVFGDRVGGGGNIGFGFNARDISGFPTGSATLTATTDENTGRAVRRPLPRRRR